MSTDTNTVSLREELPYRTEYAKSGRASCKSCKDVIPKDKVRMAVMVQSPFFDGKQANWHHFDCFFKRFRPKIEEIAHFASLKYEDQKKIEEAIAKSVGATNGGQSDTKKKTRKKKAIDDTDGSDVTEFSDFKVEYSKSGRAKCRLCDNSIPKDTIRISRLDRDSEDAHRFGPLDRWFHSECFVKARETLGFFGSADKLPFFSQLEDSDRKDLLKKMPQIDKPVSADSANGSSSPPKKIKVTKTEDKELKKQSDLMFKYQKLAEEMKKADLVQLLEHNKIEVPEENRSKYERLADAMAFGVLEKCPECKKGQLVFRISGFICTGNITQWTACEYQTTDNPKRKPFKVPKDLAETYSELKKYKFKEGVRKYNPVLKQAVEIAATTASTSNAVLPKKEESNESSNLILNGYNIAFAGKLKTTKAKLKSRLKKLGANLVDTVDNTTLCLISTKAEFDKESDKINDTKELSIPIVSEDFLDGVENGSDPLPALTLNRLETYEIDIEKRFNNLNVKEKMKTAFKSGGKSGSGRFEKSVGKQKMILKDGNVVDPDCEVADSTHIYKNGDDVYNAVLSKVDLTKNKNSYYKIQLLQHDSKPKLFYIFRSWGRVGTTIGGTSLDKYKDKEKAIEAFEQHFEEKTQNEWSRRKKFKKQPNCYFPVDIDYGTDQQIEKLDSKTSGSNLPKPVQDLICEIFDVQKMKEQMLEFELDLEKMPLGKLSKKQLLKAFSVLKELSQAIEAKPPNQTNIKDATNRFYTLIPHSFGTERPPLIDTEELIKSKMDMLDALLDIEMAYEMINSVDDKTKNMDPIDHHYHKLNANIEPLSKEEEEFAIIEKYLKNTHGSTHNFSLEIQEVFKVERHEEREQFKKFKDLDNRVLLWHGSRVTNYAGILSQGLRIAPPEAPVTGYMFGKGIYFADMVTKSAGYCHHHSNKNVGFLLLSEVAVGETWELFDAKDVKKLPKGKHSVKGVGKTTPDPNEWHTLPDGVKVPAGKGVENDAKKCSLLYNEYIVYDTNQVNIRYLLKCKFNTKSLF